MVHVVDSGDGVPADHVGQVFDHGFTTRGADVPGHGIGLALARHTARAHGGDVRLVDPGSAGHGAVFEARLAGSADRTREEPDVTTEPIRVLVVDDDFRVARLHASYVEATDGFEVVGTAHTAADARADGRRAAPGPGAARRVPARRQRLGRSCASLGAAVLMVSAAEDSEVVRRALAAGRRQLRAQAVPALGARSSAWSRSPGSGTCSASGAHLDQTGVDRALQALRMADSPVATARKGRSPVTSEAIVEVLRAAPDAVTAVDVAEATGVSRATAQRYLSDLARDGHVRLTLRYGTTGRPEHCFEWLGRRD